MIVVDQLLHRKPHQPVRVGGWVAGRPVTTTDGEAVCRVVCPPATPTQNTGDWGGWVYSEVITHTTRSGPPYSEFQQIIYPDPTGLTRLLSGYGVFFVDSPS